MMDVKTTMSDGECAVWGAEFARGRSGASSHAAVGAGIDDADQAVIDLREAFGSAHGSLTMKTSPLERAVWAAEFARVRASAESPDIKAAVHAADQAVTDVRDALGTEHSSLTMRTLRDDPAAQLAHLRERLVRAQDDK